MTCVLCKQEHDPREHIVSVELVSFRSETDVWRLLRERAQEYERHMQPELPGMTHD